MPCFCVIIVYDGGRYGEVSFLIPCSYLYGHIFFLGEMRLCVEAHMIYFLGRLGQRASEQAIHRWHGVFSSSRSSCDDGRAHEKGYTRNGSFVLDMGHYLALISSSVAYLCLPYAFSGSCHLQCRSNLVSARKLKIYQQNYLVSE